MNTKQIEVRNYDRRVSVYCHGIIVKRDGDRFLVKWIDDYPWHLKLATIKTNPSARWYNPFSWFYQASKLSWVNVDNIRLMK